MSPFLRLLCVFTITYSQEYTYNDNYQLSQSNWEATCLFYYDTHLASIHNASQLLDAQTTALDVAWIGATDTTLEGTWLWTDSTAFNYGLTNSQPPWASGEPNDETPGEDCVEIAADGLWNDLPCSSNLYNGLCASPIPTPVINDKSSYVRSRQQPGYLGMIDILDEIYIDFYITFTSWPTGWGNILQFGDSDAQKYPAIYINGVTHNVISSFATVTTSNPEQSTTTSGYELDTEYHYTLSQTQRGFKVTFGGNYEYEEIYDYTVEIAGRAVSHPIVMNQAINLGSDWDGDFGATIRNLVVTTANSPETTFWNYICDWDDRWAEHIAGTWNWGLGGSAIGGDCSIRQISTTTTGKIAWMGEKDPASLLWTDYKLEMLINLLSGDSVGPMFRATNLDCDVSNCGNSYHLTMRTTGYEFVKIADGRTVLHTHSMGAGAHTLGAQYLVRVECVGSTFKIYEENEYLFNYSDASYAAGSVGIRVYGSDARISKLRITFPQDQQWYTANPSSAPTLQPAFVPTLPTSVPTTSSPTTSVPTTSQPTLIPTFAPTSQPTLVPTSQPTAAPTTAAPTTAAPTSQPTFMPTYNPTNVPTTEPTSEPTTEPTQNPTSDPTSEPTINPTSAPTLKPSDGGSTTQPTAPTADPTADPTTDPSTDPTKEQTNAPSIVPTKTPVNDESVQTTQWLTSSTVATQSDGLLNDAHNYGFLSPDLVLLVILAVLAVSILSCCCWVCIYWMRGNQKKETHHIQNVELAAVRCNSPSSTYGNVGFVEGDAADFATGIGPTGGPANMTKINSMSSVHTSEAEEIQEKDGADDLWTQPAVTTSGGADKITPLGWGQPVVTAEDQKHEQPQQKLIQANGVPVVEMIPIPNLPPENNMNDYGQEADDFDAEEFNDLPDELEEEDEAVEEVGNDEVYNDDGDEEEYEYYYADDNDQGNVL